MSADKQEPLHLRHDCPACRAKQGGHCWVEMSAAGEPRGEITIVDGIWVHQARVQIANKHITEQEWQPEVREDGVYLVAADDRTPVLKLCRPDSGSDFLIAGYISALQSMHLKGRS